MTLYKYIYKYFEILAISIILLFFTSTVAYSLGTQVVILTSHDFYPYTITEKAIVNVMHSSLADVIIKKYVLSLWKDKEKSLINNIKSIRPDVIITLGTPASILIHKQLNSIPQVFALVVDPWRRGLIGRNIAGICLKIPVVKQLKELVRVAHAKFIGIIWTKGHKEHFNEKVILQLAKELDVRLIIKTVENSKQLPKAFQQEINYGIDSFIMVADPVLYNNLLAVKYIITQGIKYHIAVMGLAACYVTHGAFIALQPDYNYIGVQAARMAIAKLLESNDITSTSNYISIQYPGKYILYINLTIAKLLHIKILPSIKNTAVLVE